MSDRVDAGKAARRYRAKDFAVAACFCPACRHRFERPDVDRCPACGFTGEVTLRLFPFEAPPSTRLGDHAGLFSREDRKRVERELSRFTHRFPQFDFRIVTADIDPELDLRLFAFWLLNAMPLAGDETEERRQWCLLLVIRPDLSVALAPGYAAEVWTGDIEWTLLLDELQAHALADSFARGLRAFLRRLTDRMVDSWRRMADRRASGRWQRVRKAKA